MDVVQRHHLSPVAGILLAACLGPAAAKEPLPTEDDFLAGIPKVTSAARLEKSLLETGMSVTIIDRETIAASPATEIPDLLRLVPGFQVAHVTGSVFAVGYHGSSDQWPRRMDVMVDGRSVYLNTVSAVEWSALGIAMEDIERIEVVRGPNAPSFGSNALFGSINIVTKSPFLLAGKYLRGTVGPQNSGHAVARWGGRLAEWDTSLTAQYRTDDGFGHVDDDRRVTDLRFRGDYQANLTDSLTVQLGLSDGRLGADGIADDIWNRPRDRDIDSNYQQLTWDRANPEGGHYRVNLYHNYYRHDDSYRVDISGWPTYSGSPAPPFYPPGTYVEQAWYTATSERYDLEFQHELAPMDEWRIAWGLGGRYDRLSSDLLVGDESPVDKFSGRVFGSLEWRPIDDVGLSLDVLSEWHESYGTETSPRIAVNWLASDTRSFRASASRSYRVLSLLSRYMDHELVPTPPVTGVPNYPLVVSDLYDDFTPERVTSYELGYMERWNDLGLSLDLRVFREDLDDSGVAARAPGGPILWTDEGGYWDTKGFEVQLDYRPTRDTRVLGAYSWGKIDGMTGNRTDADGRVLINQSLDDTIPRHTLSLLLSQRLAASWKASLAVYHMSDVDWRGAGSELDDYTRLDLKLTHDFGFGPNDGQVAIIVHNLTGNEYNEFRTPEDSGTGNVFDRRAYLQLSLTFD